MQARLNRDGIRTDSWALLPLEQLASSTKAARRVDAVASMHGKQGGRRRHQMRDSSETDRFALTQRELINPRPSFSSAWSDIVAGGLSQACNEGHVKSRLGLGAVKHREQRHSSCTREFLLNSRVVLWPLGCSHGSHGREAPGRNPFQPGQRWSRTSRQASP